VPEPSRVVLASCAHLPRGDGDDDRLAELLGAEFVPWDAPGFDWSAPALVVVRATWDYQRRRDEFLRWARSLDGRILNPPAVLEWNTDKRYLHELEDAGLPVVHTELLEPGDELTVPATEFVVKPTVSAGSRDTARFSREEASRASALVAEIHGSGRTAMVQPYVGSVDLRGETAVLFFDGAYSHAIHKGPLLRPGADPTQEVFAAEDIAARAPTPAEREVAERVVAWTTERFGGSLPYTRVDLVEDGTGAPLVLELELTEPSLFFAHADGATERFAAAIRRRLDE
jgi:glutathione synthase/RimK-type ligase-like ATP-grasp enzyme